MLSPSSRDAAVRSGIVGLAAILSGIGSYALLIIVSKNTSGAQYADFAIFWSLTVTIGLGFYYPVEQETAREVAGTARGPRSGLAGFVVGVGGILTLITGLGALLLLTPGGLAYIGDSSLVYALIASFVAYAVQFPLRGLLSGSQRTNAYSSVIAVEGLLRIALPFVLVLIGMTSTFAFAMVVAVAALGAVVPVFFRADREWLRRGHADPGLYASRVARLVGAAFSIQLLLNSGVLLTRFFETSADAALAGQILTCLSIARIPVFGYQVLQILYLPRLAANWKDENSAAVRKVLTIALGAAAVVGVAIIGGMALLGQWVTGLIFDADLVLAQNGIVLVSAGVALFIPALVASDGAIAIGKHTLVLRSWLVAVVCAAVPALIIDDTLLRVTTPLIVGALVAFVQLVYGITRTYRARFSEVVH